MDFQEILREYGVSFKAEPDRLIVNCPFHADSNPSAVIFTERGNFYCSGCGKKSSIYEFLAKKHNTLIGDVYHAINKEFADNAKSINMQEVERLHSNLLQEQNRALLEELHKRGIPDEVIRKRRLGVLKDRITIPIPNRAEVPVNIRAHKPGAAKAKVVNKAGYGKPPRLYPIDQLAFDHILLVGGELKALAASAELNQYGVGSVTCTHGEGTWPLDVLDELKGYNIYVCMDIDDAGKSASEKLCQILQGRANKLFKVNLPLDPETYPKGDVNDFIHAFPGQLVELLRKCEEWEFEPERQYEENGKPEYMSLTQAMLAENAKKRVSFKAIASAVERSPFILPRSVEVKCGRNAKGLCQICQIPKATKPENQVMEVQKESPSLMRMVKGTETEKSLALMEEFKIPKNCKVVSFNSLTHYNVESVRVSSETDISSRSAERDMQAAYCIGESLELNECYQMTGRMFPHPKTQEATLMISSMEATVDSLSSYELPDMEKLNIFQPEEWTVDGIKAKLNDIYSDFEANLTRIFERRALILGMDLAYHSPLFIQFDDSEVKGWVETLILGDSSVGKSETLKKLMEHYGLGEKIDCKGVTEAGLKGGLQKFNDVHFVTWGALVQNDKRLLAMEELHGMDIEVFSKITEVRSSGRAVLTKIEKRSANARTRLIAISNPRKFRRPRTIATYNYGLDAIVELIGSMEDIRRFDLCLILDQNEVDTERLQSFRPVVDHKYTSDLCRELILWCWTTKHATFENEKTVLDVALSLCSNYSDVIPIVDRGSMRLKIARLAAALAGRTFSHDGDGGILVRDCHIKYIERFLNNEYSKPCFGYKEFSEAQREAESLVNEEAIVREINATPFPKEFAANMISQSLITVFSIGDLLGWDQTTSRDLLGFLIRNRALHREERGYRKTVAFTRLLKEALDKGTIKDVPEHIRKPGEKF